MAKKRKPLEFHSWLNRILDALLMRRVERGDQVRRGEGWCEWHTVC